MSITADSVIIDVAALGEKMPAPEKDNSYVIKTGLISMGGSSGTDSFSEAEFKRLFYSKDGENFSLNTELCCATGLDSASGNLVNAMTFDKQKVTSREGCALDTVVDLNLKEELFACYEKDLEVDRDCWEVCSRVELNKAIACLRTLCNVGDGCNVLCSLKYSELLRTLTNCKPVSLSGATSGVNNIMQVSAVFKSCNPKIRDCVVIFRFLVTGLTY